MEAARKDWHAVLHPRDETWGTFYGTQYIIWYFHTLLNMVSDRIDPDVVSGGLQRHRSKKALKGRTDGN